MCLELHAEFVPRADSADTRGWLQGSLREHPKTHATHVVLECSKNNRTMFVCNCAAAVLLAAAVSHQDDTDTHRSGGCITCCARKSTHAIVGKPVSESNDVVVIALL